MAYDQVRTPSTEQRPDNFREPVAPEFVRCRYHKVLEECAVFLLCRALRAVLLKRLIFDLHMLEWRATEA